MLIAILFALGTANFAMSRAVLESGHPMVAALPDFYRRRGGRVALMLEFVLLCLAMLLVHGGMTGAAIAYSVYTGANLGFGWAIVSRRI